MGARQKLNQAHLLGAVGIAAIVGALTQSWVSVTSPPSVTS